MRYLLKHYNITIINSFKYKSYEVFDAFENNDSIWETNEYETVKQVRDDYSNEKSDSNNVNFVNKKVNLKIFEFSNKKNDNDKNKMNIDNDENDDDDEKKESKSDRDIIEIWNDE